MNILEEFGYEFKDEIPPVFRHSQKKIKFHHASKPDLDIDLKEGSEKFKSIHVSIERNWRNLNDLIHGRNFNENKSDDEDKYDSENDYIYNINNTKHKPFQIDKIKCLKKLIYDCENESNSDDWKDNFYFTHDTVQDKHILNSVTSDYKNNVIKYNSINKNNKDNEIIYNNILNDKNKNDKNYHNNFITMNPSLKASSSEMMEAKNHKYNKELKETDLSYLKMLEKWKPRQYAHLYDKTIKFREKWKRNGMFAKYTCDRRTLNVEPCTLGIKPEHRNTTVRIEQYPLNRQKRIQMIGYTTECDKNGFWLKMDCSINNNTYTMILRAPDLSGHRRGRPVFDFRKLNSLCELIQSYMPTMRDFDEFFAQPGLITTFDFKNYFDCIPLAKSDWAFAVVSTPLGIRKMTHLSYGFKNAAPHAQRIMNELSSKVRHMIGYIDDGALKHPLSWNTDQLIEHLEELFIEAQKYNFLIHPEKFFPFCTEVDSLGIHRTLYGSSLTESYKKKVLDTKTKICR